MTFYHATYADRIAAIQKEGLRPMSILQRNFPEAVHGVYLSTDPWIAIGVLLEHSLDPILEGWAPPTASPKELVESYRIIVIDRSRVREELLMPDPQVEGADMIKGIFWLYPGVVDVTGMPVLDTEQLGPPAP